MLDDSMLYERFQNFHRVVLNRPEQHNSLTPAVVNGLTEALEACERDAAARSFIVEGSGGHFSSGMDLAEAADGPGARGAGGDAFLRLLERFTVSRVVVISLVDGKVSGGGVGLAAASDFAFATPESQFSLPEALWGLLPCAVAPFLIRRVGFQVCQRMTLSTLPLSGEEAFSRGLVDSLDESALPRLLQRLQSIAPEAIGEAKRYLHRLWIVDESTLNTSIDKLDELLASPAVSRRLIDFARNKRYPWEQNGVPQR